MADLNTDCPGLQFRSSFRGLRRKVACRARTEAPSRKGSVDLRSPGPVTEKLQAGVLRVLRGLEVVPHVFCLLFCWVAFGGVAFLGVF